MRWLTTLAMVLALLLGVAGCGGSRAGSSVSSSSSRVEGDMELAKEVATALGQKATAAFRWENCPSEEGCTYHAPTTFDVNEANGCTPTTENPGYNWECNFIEVNEAGRGDPNNWLVDKEANGCWKVVELDEHAKWERGGKTLNEYEREGEHSKPQEPETPYVENCTQSGRESIGRHGRLVPATSEQSQSTTQPESTETTPTASTPEATTGTSPRSASSPPQTTTECTAYLTRPGKPAASAEKFHTTASCRQASQALQNCQPNDRDCVVEGLDWQCTGAIPGSETCRSGALIAQIAWARVIEG
jgi:hypothetical protein